MIAAVATIVNQSTPYILGILGALFTLNGASFLFTWLVFMEMRKVNKNLFERIEEVRDNDIAHLEERIIELEKK